MTPPERIWLQWHGDAEEWEDGEVDPGDASWAPHKVWNRDIEYVIAPQADVRLSDVLAQLVQELEGTLIELRCRLHAAGRRPEECYEMSMIDATLSSCRNCKP